jgi:hypothetical protein
MGRAVKRVVTFEYRPTRDDVAAALYEYRDRNPVIVAGPMKGPDGYWYYDIETDVVEGNPTGDPLYATLADLSAWVDYEAEVVEAAADEPGVPNDVAEQARQQADAMREAADVLAEASEDAAETAAEVFNETGTPSDEQPAAVVSGNPTSGGNPGRPNVAKNGNGRVGPPGSLEQSPITDATVETPGQGSPIIHGNPDDDEGEYRETPRGGGMTCNFCEELVPWRELDTHYAQHHPDVLTNGNPAVFQLPGAGSPITHGNPERTEAFKRARGIVGGTYALDGIERLSDDDVNLLAVDLLASDRSPLDIRADVMYGLTDRAEHERERGERLRSYVASLRAMAEGNPGESPLSAAPGRAQPMPVPAAPPLPPPAAPTGGADMAPIPAHWYTRPIFGGRGR